MSRPIKHACINCGYPRWRHKEENRLPKTCERFKGALKPIPTLGTVVEKVSDENGVSIRVELNEAGKKLLTPPVCPEPMTGGE